MTALLEGHLGKRGVAKLLRSMPVVLNQSVDTLGWHQEELAGMFGPKRAAAMVLRWVQV